MEAERLFRHYGYAKTTVADIAEACGMSPSNVYRFFASKLEINEGICDRIIADQEHVLRGIADGPGTAAERLRLFIRELHRFTRETLLDQRKVHDMVVVAMEEQWSVVQAHLERTTGIIAGLIASGVKSGEFKPIDPVYAARCVHCAAACLKHPVIVAQCLEDSNQATPDEMADFLLLALKV
jgi:AcrR family transcriptional regulator